MYKTTTLLSAFSLLAASVSAVPEVEVRPINAAVDSCNGYPSRFVSPSADTTGAWYIKAVADDFEGVTDLFAVPRTIPWGAGTLTPLTIDLRKSTRFAKTRYFCNNGQLLQYGNGPTFTISKDVSNAQFTQATTGYRPQLYEHYVDGVKQDGVYLGALNQTTWAFSYRDQQADGTCAAPYYGVRLTGLPVDPETEPTAGYRPEFYGFLKVTSS